jgi:hypothetical protein
MHYFIGKKGDDKNPRPATEEEIRNLGVVDWGTAFFQKLKRIRQTPGKERIISPYLGQDTSN